ncbi:MAG: MotA/TolQ/ExbB proton channel family protein [Polyangiaceae bacterium]|nr:MotA/TolQ/ExbB proton channel family protein [Polyangiaceae bacterium]
MIVEKLLQVALLGSEWVMYLMLALSVFSIGAMLERFWFFVRRNQDPDEITEAVVRLVEQDQFASSVAYLKSKAKRSFEASVVLPAMRYFDGGPAAFNDAVEAEFIKTRQELERSSNLLGTLGNNAPFIGLFGTVIGVVIAFQQLGKTQGAGNMGNVMSGIAEALVATGVGLFVAIPAVVAYNIIQGRIGFIEGNVTSLTKKITAVMKAKRDNPDWQPDCDPADAATPAPAAPVNDREAFAAEPAE